MVTKDNNQESMNKSPTTSRFNKWVGWLTILALGVIAGQPAMIITGVAEVTREIILVVNPSLPTQLVDEHGEVNE